MAKENLWGTRAERQLQTFGGAHKLRVDRLDEFEHITTLRMDHLERHGLSTLPQCCVPGGAPLWYG